jgi:hypothetical protein
MLLSVTLFAFQRANAQGIINVSNVASGVHIDYTSLTNAVSNAQAGDTIYIYPSSATYGSVTIDKQLTIIGPGYDVQLNPTLEISTYTGSVILDVVTISGSADGTIITACDINELRILGQSNITIKRNRIRREINVEQCSNILINANYFNSTENYGCYSCADGFYHVRIIESSSVLVSNNLFDAFSDASGGCTPSFYNYGFDNLLVNPASDAIILNNSFRDRVIVHNSVLKNNIFLLTEQYSTCADFPISHANSIIQYNVLVDTLPELDATNYQNAIEADLFVAWPIQGSQSFDSRFHLQSGSPAAGAGEGGVDCGPFAGADPYKLSGIPFIPVVYEINAPASGTATDGIDVHIKVRSNN